MRSYFKIYTLIFLLACSLPSYGVDLKMENLNGNKFNFLSEYKGKWVVIYFWGILHESSETRNLYIQQLKSFYKNNKNAVVIGVNITGNSVTAQKMINQHSISYPMYKIEPTRETSLGNILAIPTFFLISPEGDIKAKQVGSDITREMIENFIAQSESKERDINEVVSLILELESMLRTEKGEWLSNVRNLDANLIRTLKSILLQEKKNFDSLDKLITNK